MVKSYIGGFQKIPKKNKFKKNDEYEDKYSKKNKPIRKNKTQDLLENNSEDFVDKEDYEYN